MTKKKILVVDDEQNMTRMLKRNLEATGRYDVRTENSGAAGVTAAREFQPDLILLDIMMPKMDGYTFLKKMKGDTQLRRIPVIVLTAKAKMSELFALEDVRDYIVKPYEPKDLLEKVKKYLS
jgi:CheY-like chemotaxis protein